MKENWPAAFAALLEHEGGFVNDPKDPGGMTNLGVTRSVWREYTGREATEDEMRSLTPQTVEPLYKKRYWDALRCDDLPAGVDVCVFDCSVNSGTQFAARLLQRVCGAQVDGSIGPRTLAAVRALNPHDIIDNFTQRRELFVKGLPTFNRFGKGWLARIAAVERQATDLAPIPVRGDYIST